MGIYAIMLPSGVFSVAHSVTVKSIIADGQETCARSSCLPSRWRMRKASHRIQVFDFVQRTFYRLLTKCHHDIVVDTSLFVLKVEEPILPESLLWGFGTLSTEILTECHYDSIEVECSFHVREFEGQERISMSGQTKDIQTGSHGIQWDVPYQWTFTKGIRHAINLYQVFFRFSTIQNIYEYIHWLIWAWIKYN